MNKRESSRKCGLVSEDINKKGLVSEDVNKKSPKDYK